MVQPTPGPARDPRGSGSILPGRNEMQFDASAYSVGSDRPTETRPKHGRRKGETDV